MYKTRWDLLAVAGMLLTGVSVGQTQSIGAVADSDRDRSALSDSDTRLDGVITCNQRNSTTEALAREVARESKLGLAVHPRLQPARLSVLNGKNTLRSVLQGMEWVANATWTSSDNGVTYVFRRTKRDNDRIELAAAKARRAGIDRLRERFDKVRQWSTFDDQQLQALSKFEPGKAKTLKNYQVQATTRMAFNLPGALWAKLWSDGTVRVPLRQLSPNLQQLAARGGPVNDERHQTGLTSEKLLAEGLLKLQIAGPPDRPTIWVSVGTKTDAMDTNLLYSEGWTREPPANRRAAAEAHPTVVPDDPLFRKKVSILDPASPHSPSVGERPRKCLPLLPLLEQVAKQTGATVIIQTDFRPRSDEPVDRPDPLRYRRINEGWLEGQWWLADDIHNQPLAKALDLLCADFEYEWSFKQGVILLRHRRWYLPDEERDHGKPLQRVFPS